jgi:hypothetical protein
MKKELEEIEWHPSQHPQRMQKDRKPQSMPTNVASCTNVRCNTNSCRAERFWGRPAAMLYTTGIIAVRNRI